MLRNQILTFDTIAAFERKINRDTSTYDAGLQFLPGRMEIRHQEVDPKLGIRALRRSFNVVYLLHQMGEDLTRLLAECYEVLAPDGLLLVVEAQDYRRVSEAIYQRMHCITGTLLPGAAAVEHSTDNREGELNQAAAAAGFHVFRQVTETLYDKVYGMRAQAT